MSGYEDMVQAAGDIISMNMARRRNLIPGTLPAHRASPVLAHRAVCCLLRSFALQAQGAHSHPRGGSPSSCGCGCCGSLRVNLAFREPSKMMVPSALAAETFRCVQTALHGLSAQLRRT